MISQQRQTRQKCARCKGERVGESGGERKRRAAGFKGTEGALAPAATKAKRALLPHAAVRGEERGGHYACGRSVVAVARAGHCSQEANHYRTAARVRTRTRTSARTQDTGCAARRTRAVVTVPQGRVGGQAAGVGGGGGVAAGRRGEEETRCARGVEERGAKTQALKSAAGLRSPLAIRGTYGVRRWFLIASIGLDWIGRFDR